jgi:hypothetical protein
MFRRTAVSAALVALLAGTASTSPAHAATPRDGAFRYTESAGNATIVGWDPDVAACPSALSIPATVGASIPVTEIDDSAFLDEPCMKSGATTSLTLPTSVTTLNPSAFRGDSSLTAITINGALTNIPAYAFAGNTGLQTITFNANGPAYVETAFAGVSPTASGGPRVIYKDGTQDCSTGTCVAWGETYATFDVTVRPSFHLGQILVQQVTRKASTVTFYPTYSANSAGTVSLILYTVSKSKKGKLVSTVHCSATGAVLHAGTTGFECVTGKAARKLVRKRTTKFYVRATFTQLGTGLTTNADISTVTVKRAK